MSVELNEHHNHRKYQAIARILYRIICVQPAMVTGYSYSNISRAKANILAFVAVNAWSYIMPAKMTTLYLILIPAMVN